MSIFIKMIDTDVNDVVGEGEGGGNINCHSEQKQCSQGHRRGTHVSQENNIGGGEEGFGCNGITPSSVESGYSDIGGMASSGI